MTHTSDDVARARERVTYISQHSRKGFFPSSESDINKCAAGDDDGGHGTARGHDGTTAADRTEETCGSSSRAM